SGYITKEARKEFFENMDAVNVDLKGLSEDFYQHICGGKLSIVLDNLKYLRKEKEIWLEISTLLLPGENDSVRDINLETEWIYKNLGPDVPLHFTAFHPHWKSDARIFGISLPNRNSSGHTVIIDSQAFWGIVDKGQRFVSVIPKGVNPIVLHGFFHFFRLLKSRKMPTEVMAMPVTRIGTKYGTFPSVKTSNW
ncbi:hypothetical protein BVX98_00445, partial [bacterium F11]